MPLHTLHALHVCLPDGEEAPLSSSHPAKAAGSATTFPANSHVVSPQQLASRHHTSCQGWTYPPHHNIQYICHALPSLPIYVSVWSARCGFISQLLVSM